MYVTVLSVRVQRITSYYFVKCRLLKSHVRIRQKEKSTIHKNLFWKDYFVKIKNSKAALSIFI